MFSSYLMTKHDLVKNINKNVNSVSIVYRNHDHPKLNIINMLHSNNCEDSRMYNVSRNGELFSIHCVYCEK